jgi:hypothetical protein
VRRYSLAKKLYAFAKLFDAVDTVLDADPSVKASAGQLLEDRVVVVQAAADDP